MQSVIKKEKIKGQSGQQKEKKAASGEMGNVERVIKARSFFIRAFCLRGKRSGLQPSALSQ